jgi:muramidase (phage lysozyme)
VAVISAAEAGHPNIPLFLDLAGWSEGTVTNPATQCDGYDVIVTGIGRHLNIFTDFSNHPFADGRPPIVLRQTEQGAPTLRSDASGRYQIMLKTWRDYRTILSLPDFGPHSQDVLAIHLLRERNVPHLLIGNEIAAAIHACSNLWASFPGNEYGQGGKSMDALLERFQQLKGAAA